MSKNSEQAEQNLSPEESLYRIRHSLAHVMAQAVLNLRPGSKLGFGPPIDNGFYYDFILTEPLTEAEFPKIEKEMKRIIKLSQKFECEELSATDALARIDKMGEPYKREYAEELLKKEGVDSLTFYRNGPFLDMCEGPHVAGTHKIPAGAFKLRSIAGAYWRGDEKNQMMTRIYAWAYPSKEELEVNVKKYREALARDHKKLGKELEIFFVDDKIGKGLPFWQPNGAVLREEIEKLMKEIEFKAGYQRVFTPILAKTELYYKTGHLPYYKESMFPFLEFKEKQETESGEILETKETYSLRPMNCPHHHRIYSSRPRSYRELPLRLAEYGHVFRYEDSGALSGLLRVRGMCMNDAHIYCTKDQIKKEFLAVMHMHKEVYEILGLEDYYMRLSTWDPEDPKGKEKYIDNPAAWAETEKILVETMEESGLPFKVGKGEAAFYGPKVDFQFKTVTGREETASTNQLDFGIAERLGLTYVGSDNQEHSPYIIHRAPCGTHERFVAYLIERYGGAFPTWLAPVQVLVVPVGEKYEDYATKLADQLRSDFIRAEIDRSSDTLNKKIRNATTQKIPNILVVGEKEQAEETVTLRHYGSRDQKTLPVAEFHSWVLDQIKNRTRPNQA